MVDHGPLLYAQLIGFTAGTVLFLFLLVLFLGYRRRREFEGVLFFLSFALFLFYSGALLELNTVLAYGHSPVVAGTIAYALQLLALLLLPPLLLHAHAAYAFVIGMVRRPRLVKVLTRAFYAVPILCLPLLLPGKLLTAYEEAAEPLLWFAQRTDLWLCASLAACAVLQLRFARFGGGDIPRRLHGWLAGYFLAGMALVLYSQALDAPGFPVLQVEWLDTAVELLPLAGGGVLAYQILRRNLLGISASRNLVYVVTGGFLAVLYLTVVQRVSQWLEPEFPPVATTSILVFVLVFLFEPLQRMVSRALERATRGEVAKVQALMAEFQLVARGANLEQLVQHIEPRIQQEFSLASVGVALQGGARRPAARSGNVKRFPLRSEQTDWGVMEAWHHGSILSGETYAALESLAGQLPAVFGLCRLIEEKLALERQLAERERLALLGQMAASISHNLKNPLGSMKTLLQVQLEKPDLPEDLRKDCEVVVAEIDRLAAKLRQLLEYSRPAMRGEPGAVDAVAVADEVVRLLVRDAERRRVAVVVERPAQALRVRGAREAVSDIVQNLLVNAVEATPAGGRVLLRLEQRDAGTQCAISVSDDGPGIPLETRARIFQPFFTTKPSGTGLGLAIVSRRLAELGGTITCQSPLRDGRGTQFTATLPLWNVESEAAGK